MVSAGARNSCVVRVVGICLLVCTVLCATPLAAQNTRFVYGADGTHSSINGALLDIGASRMTAIDGSPFATSAVPFTLAVHPSGKFLYAANQNGAVSGFCVDPSTGALTEMAGSPVAGGAGSNPLAIVFDASGKYMYVLNQTGALVNGQFPPWGTLNSYSIDQSTGALTPIGSPLNTQYIPVALVASRVAESIYLASTDGTNSTVKAFSVDPATGQISSIGSTSEANTRTMAMTPDGKLLFVGYGQLAGNIISYTINTNGTLSQTSATSFLTAGNFPVALGVDGTGSFLYGFKGGFVINTSNGVLSALSPAQTISGWTKSFLEPGNEFIYGTPGFAYYQVAAGGTLTRGPISGISFPSTYSAVGIPPVASEAPAITTQPANETTVIGQTATFTVVASGSPAPTYQWRKNNVTIPGATSASYTTPPATIWDDGATYKASVSNALGAVTSDIVTLSVPHIAPSVTSQPVSQTVNVGQTATFTVAGTGTGPLLYQWRKNNISISGATSSSYTTPPATLGDNGTQYVVSISNTYSGTTSNVVTLGVTSAASAPPAITMQPVGQTVGIGQTATFTVAVSGGGTLSYQWKKNNASIPGATSASYTTPPATINDDGATYKVGIQNNLGGVTSNVVTLSVPHSAASITTQPTDVTISAGQSATFTVAGTGTVPLFYQWRKNNISIAGATSSSYSTPPVTLADDGTTYVVSVQNSFSGITSNFVTLHVTP